MSKDSQTFVVSDGSAFIQTERVLPRMSPLHSRRLRQVTARLEERLDKPVQFETHGWVNTQYTLYIAGFQVTPFIPWESMVVFINGLLTGHRLHHPNEEASFNDGVRFAEARAAQLAQESYTAASEADHG